MPTYEYICDSCQHEFEVFQSMKDARLTTCPECGEAIRRKLGTGAGIIFKGSGFYETDYRKESYTKAAKADQAQASSASSSSSSSSSSSTTPSSNSSGSSTGS